MGSRNLSGDFIINPRFNSADISSEPAPPNQTFKACKRGYKDTKNGEQNLSGDSIINPRFNLADISSEPAPQIRLTGTHHLNLSAD